MVSKIHMERKKKQENNIPSPQVQIFNDDGSKKIIDNPDIEEVKK